jgi:transcriptional regulator with XRE-family HTH domain
MTISERLFQVMSEKGISVPDLARLTGISRQTIYDWQKKNTNPGADKIMIICESLGITPAELLLGSGSPDSENAFAASGANENTIIEAYRELSDSKKSRLLAYLSMLQNTKE